MSTVSLFICGDIVNQFSDVQFIDSSLKEIIRGCDYSIANLEGPMCRNKEVSPMRQRPNTIKHLKDAGFNMLLLANNHITDDGLEGLQNTIKHIEEERLDHMGASTSYDMTYHPLIKNFGDITLGFINICEAQVGQFVNRQQKFGYAWLGDINLKKRIEELKKSVDYVIVFVHAGLEHYPLPLKEYRDFYRNICDYGADSVVCSHPHIAQGVEEYGKKYIFYSLGNFYFPRDIGSNSLNIENCSFSIILKLDKQGISYSTIGHSMDNLMVKLDNDRVDIAKMNSELKYPKYDELIIAQNSEAYNSKLMSLYREAVVGVNPNEFFLKRLKFCLKVLLFPRLFLSNINHREAILKRLVENETYRYLLVNYINQKK